MQRSALLVAVFFAGVLLAGCLGGDGAEPADGTSAEEGNGTPGVPKGPATIHGRLFTEDLKFLADARVVLVQEGDQVDETHSDEEGLYRFEEVAAGEYRLHVTAGCCREKVQRVTVAPGEVRDVDFMLDFFSDTDLEQPFVVRNEWTGFYACSVRVIVSTADDFVCDSDPNQDRHHTITVDEGIRGVVFALEFEQGALHFSGEMQIRMYHGNSFAGTTYVAAEGPSPVEAIVGPSDGDSRPLGEIDGPFDLRFRVFSGGVGEPVDVIYQQEFTLYYDQYYWQTPRSGASALPTDR